MILVLGGTADGRKLAESIHAAGYPVLVSTATEYGGTLVDGPQVRSGSLDAAGFQELYQKEGIALVVDATHPFAVNVSAAAIASCHEAGISYVRYERASSYLPESPLIYRVDSFAAAAEKSGELGECIFLGTGSNNLRIFTESPGLRGKKLVARVLPTPAVLQKCLDSGLKQGNIIAMQGPYSVELNKAMFTHFCVQVLVSKDSGPEGGTEEKVQAAIDLGIPVVMVNRPRLEYPAIVEDWPSLKHCLEAV